MGRNLVNLLDVALGGTVLDEILHAAQLASLPLCEVVFVCRSAVERQRIVRVLGVLLMEDVVLSVLPVGERCLVRARLLDGLRRLHNVCNLWLRSFSFLPFVLRFVRRLEVHLVRVDDLGLLLKIEGRLVVLHLGLPQLAMIVLSVVREESLRVGVAHKTISATSLSRALVPRWQRLDCYNNWPD